MARKVYTSVSYPQRSAAKRRSTKAKTKPKGRSAKSGTDWTKWAVVGSAVALAFLLFRTKEAKASTLRPALPPTPTSEPTSVVGQGRFFRVGVAGKMQCFDQVADNFVDEFFCEQMDKALTDDSFFFPDELKR